MNQYLPLNLVIGIWDFPGRVIGKVKSQYNESMPSNYNTIEVEAIIKKTTQFLNIENSPVLPQQTL